MQNPLDKPEGSGDYEMLYNDLLQTNSKKTISRRIILVVLSVVTLIFFVFAILKKAESDLLRSEIDLMKRMAHEQVAQYQMAMQQLDEELQKCRSQNK